jgi:hypothetical protein
MNPGVDDSVGQVLFNGDIRGGNPSGEKKVNTVTAFSHAHTAVGGVRATKRLHHIHYPSSAQCTSPQNLVLWKVGPFINQHHAALCSCLSWMEAASPGWTGTGDGQWSGQTELQGAIFLLGVQIRNVFFRNLSCFLNPTLNSNRHGKMKSQAATSMYRFQGIQRWARRIFPLMKFFNLITIVELRFVNFFYPRRWRQADARCKEKGKRRNLEYLPGMLVGFMTALMASIFFAAFVFLYLSFYRSRADGIYPEHTTLRSIPLSRGCRTIIILEGVASGAILSFALMHLFNKDSSQG